MNKFKQQYVEMEDQKRLKKQMEERDKMQEFYNNKKNFEENQAEFRDNYGKFKKNVYNKNMKVYDNMSKFYDYIKKKDGDNQDFYNNRSFAIAVDPKQVNHIIIELV